MVLIFGIAGAVAAAFALWTRVSSINPVLAEDFAIRVHTQTNVLVRVASVAHSVISLFAGLRPARLPSMPRGSRALHSRFSTTAGELRENGEDDGDDE